jgi:RHS repeat-associated protein
MENVNYLIASTSAGNIEAYAHENVVVGDKAFELSNHLGNFNDTWVLSNKTLSGINPVRNLSEATGVLNTITDKKLPEFDATTGDLAFFNADVVGYSDYYPFGMQMPERNGSTGDYRYGFNGMEQDDEIKGTGNSYTTQWRQYDHRIGRWLRLDPLAHTLGHLSPYHFSLNNPINVIDGDGQFPIIINGRVSKDSERGSSTYWNWKILKTIQKQTGYKLGKHSVVGSSASKSQFSGDFYFVDGDKGFNASERNGAGHVQACVDADEIWSKMKETMKDGQITEQLQIISHSRGTAFAKGYMESLRQQIKMKAEKEGIGFAYDDNSIIEYSVNLAPHQSNYINFKTSGTKNVNISHIGDPLSGDDATGDVINVHSIPQEDSGAITQHGNGSFASELNFVLKTLESGVKKGDLMKVIKSEYKNYDDNRKNGGKSTVTKGSN